VYLPPYYSPDFNPIEECFSFIKAWLRRHEKDAINPDVRPWLIHQALLAFTFDNAEGWFRNCGYESSMCQEHVMNDTVSCDAEPVAASLPAPNSCI